jgi:hypothetical protein
MNRGACTIERNTVHDLWQYVLGSTELERRTAQLQPWVTAGQCTTECSRLLRRQGAGSAAATSTPPAGSQFLCNFWHVAGLNAFAAAFQFNQLPPFSSQHFPPCRRLSLHRLLVRILALPVSARRYALARPDLQYPGLPSVRLSSDATFAFFFLLCY